MTVLLPNELKTEKIQFGEIKSMKNGGKIVNVHYDNSEFNLQTPEIRLPFDVSEYKEDDNNIKYNFVCSMDNCENSKQMKELFDKLNDIDTAVRNFAKENSMAFFKKKTMSDDTIESLYNPIVKISRDPETGEPNGKYAPSFKVKVKKRDGKFKCRLYDNKKKEFDINRVTDNPSNLTSLLVKDTKCKMLIKFSGIWLINGKFGCGWDVVQGRLNIPTKELNEYAFRDDEDDVEFVDSDGDDDDGNENNDKDSTDDSNNSDDEDSEEEDTPPPPPVKKKVRKVKTSK